MSMAYRRLCSLEQSRYVPREKHLSFQKNVKQQIELCFPQDKRRQVENKRLIKTMQDEQVPARDKKLKAP